MERVLLKEIIMGAGLGIVGNAITRMGGTCQEIFWRFRKKPKNLCHQ
jgi:hypothetical protein